MAGRMHVSFLKNGGSGLFFFYCISVGITEPAASVGLILPLGLAYADAVIGIVREMP